MKPTSNLGWVAGAVLLLTLAACGGDGGSSPVSLGSAGSDGNVNGSEAGVLLRDTTETGEPENIDSLQLATSENEEPFDLAD